MERSFDAVVVGSGSAGTAAATTLRGRGHSVAVIDERPFGGTCMLRGCDPKKVLVAAARALDEAQRWNALGVFDCKPALDWPQLMRFKRTFTDPVPEERIRSYEKAGIVPIHGTARFTGVQTLAVGEDRIRAKQIVIASGARELHVAKGDDLLLTSETFLELESMPESLVFVGGGYIAFEFAHVAARAGARVTLLNDSAEPLRGFDPDLVQRLLAVSREAGIEICLETRVESVERSADGVAVHTGGKDGARTFRARNGVLAAGRVPNLESLDLEKGGVERTKKGVKVDRRLRSVSNPNVYAAGDAADAGGLPLTPVAGYEGELAAENALGGEKEPDFRGLVTMVYTIPPLGSSGLTEAQARAQGYEVEVHAGDMSGWYETRHLAAHAAFYKVVTEKGSGKILGAAIFGPNAEQQINVLALAARYGLEGGRAASTLFAYPTGSSDLEFLVSGA
jgi:glutathione reductase (NADPH)